MQDASASIVTTDVLHVDVTAEPSISDQVKSGSDCDCPTEPGFQINRSLTQISPKVMLSQGAASFAGVVMLPQVCRDAPEKIVFLLRHDPDLANPSLAGKFVAYGAGRVVR